MVGAVLDGGEMSLDCGRLDECEEFTRGEVFLAGEGEYVKAQGYEEGEEVGLARGESVLDGIVGHICSEYTRISSVCQAYFRLLIGMPVRVLTHGYFQNILKLPWTSRAFPDTPMA